MLLLEEELFFFYMQEKNHLKQNFFLTSLLISRISYCIKGSKAFNDYLVIGRVYNLIQMLIQYPWLEKKKCEFLFRLKNTITNSY